MWARAEQLFPQQPLLYLTGLKLEFPVPLMFNDLTSVTPADVFELWADKKSQARRTQAIAVASEEVRANRRAASLAAMTDRNELLEESRKGRTIINTTRIEVNNVVTASVSAMVAEIAKKRDLRVSMARVLLGLKFITAVTI